MDLFITIIASSVGVGYLIYGRKSSDLHFLISGIALMAYPYLLSGAFSVIAGIVLMLEPFVAKKYF